MSVGQKLGLVSALNRLACGHASCAVFRDGSHYISITPERMINHSMQGSMYQDVLTVSDMLHRYSRDWWRLLDATTK